MTMANSVTFVHSGKRCCMGKYRPNFLQDYYELKKLSVLCFAHEIQIQNRRKISIHFKVRNCQVVLPINVTKLSSEDRTFGLNPIQRTLQKSNFRLPSIDCISFPGYCSAILRNLTKHATNNTLLLRCVWMSHKLQTFEVNEASHYENMPIQYTENFTSCKN